MNTLEIEQGLNVQMAPETAASPEIGSGMVFDIMGMSEGYAIEKDPELKVIAQIEAGDAASANAVMAKLAELSDRMNGDPEAGERFRPLTLADLQAELESLEAADKPVTDASFVEELLESDSLVRPQAEDQAEDKAKISGEGEEPRKQGRDFLFGLRRSRLGRAVAASTLVAAGALSWASSASAGGLKDACAPSIFDKGTVIEHEMDNPGKVSQSIVIKIHFDEVDPQCDGAFKRVVSVRPQIKHPGQRKWLNEALWTPIYNGDTSGPADVGSIFLNSHGVKSLYWTPGSRVRYQEKIQEKNEVTGKIAGTRMSVHSVQVNP